MTVQNNNSTPPVAPAPPAPPPGIEQKVDNLESDVEEITEEVDVVVSDKLAAIDTTLKSILEKLNPIKAVDKIVHDNPPATSIDGAKDMSINITPPKDISNATTKNDKKRRLIRKYR